jgi:exosortase A-associated hydrolase 1
LVAVVHSPDTGARAGVVIVVGGPQYRVGSHRQFTLLARTLAENDIACLRFDYRGMGDSSGDSPGFESIDADLRSAIDRLLLDHPELNGVCLWGLCDAASAILMYAWQDVRVRSIVILNPWVRSTETEARAVIDHYYRRRLGSREFWNKLLAGGLNPLAAARDFLRNWRTSRETLMQGRSDRWSFRDRMLDGIERLKIPTLLITSGDDLTAAEFLDLIGSSPRWRQAFSRPGVTREHITGADHTFSRDVWRRQVEQRTLGWLNADGDC